ncbi:MAG: hypothetical protein ASARMPREDX12_006274 [Alectoria sarmentosa]|nr:MAG: hypothetical protein ASARMPREDX12_006274 [Alectoria sarmentosa]
MTTQFPLTPSYLTLGVTPRYLFTTYANMSKGSLVNKTSSAELSEAINSMFRWYKSANVCYAYPIDVDISKLDWKLQFRNSRWFERGWTLQELLAPSNVDFYDCEWRKVGSKDTLYSEISLATGIEFEHLVNHRIASTAQKMFWASERGTTRPEDLSYCLLGPFDINMTPIYGEGSNAFVRLQQKIAKKIDDESLFAWNDPDPDPPYNFTGMFAKSPKAFAKSGKIGPVTSVSLRLYRPPWSVTNRGLAISLYLNTALNRETGRSSRASRLELAILNCARKPGNIPFCIRLVRLSRDELARPGLGETPLEGSLPLQYLATITRNSSLAPGALSSELSLEPRQVYIRPNLAFDYSSLALFDRETWDLTLGEGYAGFVFSQINSEYMDRFLLIIRLGWPEASLDIVMESHEGRPSRSQKILRIYGDPSAWPDTKARQFEGLLRSKRKFSVTLRQGDGPGEKHCFVDMEVS